MRLTLRDYQSEALDRIDDRDAQGVRSLLGVAATGLGKTVIFCALAERRGCRTLILAHRDELIGQALGKVREVWPDAPSIGRVQAGHDDVRAHVVVASVQTLARGHRLDRLLDPPGQGLWGPPDPFGLVVVDEAHHTAAATYDRILGALNAGKPGGPLLLGVTATPDRGDGRGLDRHYDEVAFTYDILWGIRAGYLSDLRGLAVTIDNLDMGDVRVSRGDYQAGDTGRALMDAGAPAGIAQAVATHAQDRRTLVFTPTVATAQATTDALLAVGVRAAAVSGDMDMADRRSILADFADGAIECVVNCMVLTEGYDNPRVDCIVVARPTRSRALYTQMVGRGTRRHPDKADCLVLDVVGASAEHSLVTVPSLFGLPTALARQAGTRGIADLVAEHEAAEVAAGRLRAEEVQLFHRLRDDMAWVATHRDGERRRYALGLGRGQTIILAHVDPDRADGWGVQLQVTSGKGRDMRTDVRTLLRDAHMETCQAVGEEYARRHGQPHLVASDAAWRGNAPTPKQRAAARKWHLANIDSYDTAGALSDALSAHIERVRARRRGA